VDAEGGSYDKVRKRRGRIKEVKEGEGEQ